MARCRGAAWPCSAWHCALHSEGQCGPPCQASTPQHAPRHGCNTSIASPSHAPLPMLQLSRNSTVRSSRSSADTQRWELTFDELTILQQIGARPRFQQAHILCSFSFLSSFLPVFFLVLSCSRLVRRPSHSMPSSTGCAPAQPAQLPATSAPRPPARPALPCPALPCLALPCLVMPCSALPALTPAGAPYCRGGQLWARLLRLVARDPSGHQGEAWQQTQGQGSCWAPCPMASRAVSCLVTLAAAA